MRCEACPWPRKISCGQFMLNAKIKITRKRGVLVTGCNWDGVCNPPLTES